jgi:VCBS repeat-containing protein
LTKPPVRAADTEAVRFASTVAPGSDGPSPLSAAQRSVSAKGNSLAVGETPDAGVQAMRVATTSASVALPVATAPADAERVTPTEQVTAGAGVLESLVAGLTNSGDPVGSPVSWVMLAAARRQLGESVSSATMPNGQVGGSRLSAPTATAVKAAATTNASPVISGITLGTANASTGSVTGTVKAADPNGDKLTYTATTSSKGTVSISPAGMFTYTPTAAARHAAAKPGATASVTTDTVTVTVTDGKGGTATATAKVPITPKNSAPVATVSLGKPDPITGVAKGSVTATDADKDTLSYTAAKPTTGTVAVKADGSFTYTPTATARTSARSSSTAMTDTFTITVADGYGGTKSVQVTATIAPSDSAPVAGTPRITTNATTGVVTGSVNATDPDKDALTYTTSTPTTAKGAVTVTSAGVFTYTPTATARHAAARIGAPASAKSDSFTVTVTDKFGASSSVAVPVPVTPANSAPVEGKPTVATPNATTGVVTGSVTATDADRDPLTYTLTSGSTKGTVSVTSAGTFTYTPTSAARTAASAVNAPPADQVDEFSVTVVDGYGGSALIKVSVPVLGSGGGGTATISFKFTYGTGSSYWTPAAKSALESTANYFASYFVAATPITLTYTVTAEQAPDDGTLASAGSDLTSAAAGFYPTVVQNKILTGQDSNGAAPDGEIEVNFGNDWADGAYVGSNQYDFVSTLLHELLHTVGFLSYIDSAGRNTYKNWTTFDSFVVTSNGTRVIGSNGVWNTAYNTNLTGGSGGLYFGGPNAKQAYGRAVPLYTPRPWEGGSSVSHLDDFTFTGGNAQLMNAAADTGLGVRAFSPIEIGILKDLGFKITPPTVLLFIGFIFLRRRKHLTVQLVKPVPPAG